jgi:phenylalanyl-tRNA synthetase beta chain
VARAWDLDGGAAGFELDLAPIERAALYVPRYADVTSFPTVHRDLAITVPEDTPAATVVAVVEDAAGARLRRVEVFDVYRGPQVGEGNKSIALHLEFGAPDRTLTDADAHEVVAKILRALTEKVKGAYRA